MTQDEALQSLVTFAPNWYHSIEYRLSCNKGKFESSRYTLFTMPNLLGEVGMFSGQDLTSLVLKAKEFIYKTQTEQTLTQCP